MGAIVAIVAIIAIVDIAIIALGMDCLDVGMMCNCGGDFNCHRVWLEYCVWDGRIKK